MLDVEQTLRSACETDDMELLNALMTMNADKLNIILSDVSHGYLHIAAYCGSSRVVKKLLDHGVSANAIDRDGASPIHAAIYMESCREGLYEQLDYACSMEVIQTLIDHGADVTKTDQSFSSVLHGWAAVGQGFSDGNCKDALEIFLRNGVDVMLQNDVGETMLHAAALANRSDRIKDLHATLEPAKLVALTLVSDKSNKMAVHTASYAGCVETLELLRTFHPVQGQLSEDGRNEVSYAAQGAVWGTETLELLLNSGIEASLPAKNGSTAIHSCVGSLGRLHFARPHGWADRAANCFANAIKMLQAHGCDCSQAQDDGVTPLHLLCYIIGKHGFHREAAGCEFCQVFVDCTDILLDRLDDFSSKDKDGRAAIEILLSVCFRTSAGRFDIQEVNYAALEALHKILLRCSGPEHIKAIKYRGISILGIAAMLCHNGMCLRLLELGADPDEKGELEHSWTPLQHMCYSGCSSEVIESALAVTRSVQQKTDNGETLLHLATYTRGLKSHFDVLKALIHAGVDVDARSDRRHETALFSSSRVGSLDEMDILLAAGANVNATDDAGWTPLARACWGGQLEAVQLLVNAGATTFAAQRHLDDNEIHRTAFGTTPLMCGPLHFAAESGNIELVRLLLDSEELSADSATEKASPLWFASYFGQSDVVGLLLQYGYDPDDVDPVEHFSCLHVAVVFNQLSVMRLLLDAGCNAQALDRLQRTPMDLAVTYGNQAAIQVLSSHSARNLQPSSTEVYHA